MIGRKEQSKLPAEAQAERETAANLLTEAEREMFWKDLISWNPQCFHCGEELPTRRNASVFANS